MKRKLSTFAILLVIVCLCGSMLILAACNPKTPDEGKTDYSKKTSVMFDEIVSNLKTTLSPGETFGIDVAASFVKDDKTEVNDDVTFKLTAKGDLGLNKTGNDEASNFVIELVKVKGETNETVLGVAYEVIEGIPYFYVNLFNSGYVKVNGISLSALYAMFKPADEAATAAEGSLVDIKASLLAAIFGTNGTVKDGVYTLNFNVKSAAKTLQSVATLPGIDGTINKFIKDNLGIEVDLNDLISKLCGSLTYTKDDGPVTVTNLLTLLEYVEQKIDLSGTIVFSFDANKKLTGASINADSKTANKVTDNYSIKADKVFIGVTATPINAFENFTITGKDVNGAESTVRKDIVGHNLLNFRINGTATASTGDQVNHKYVISINSDINPFGLLTLIKSHSPADIIAAVKTLGYFNLTVDEIGIPVLDDWDDPVLDNEGKPTYRSNNVLTLHSKFDEGKFILNLDALPVMGPTSFGGVYEFDSFATVLGNLFPKNASTTADEGAGIDIGALLKQLLGAIDTQNIKENGVTVNTSAINKMINDLLGLGIELDKSDFLFGGTSLNIKISDTTFGAAERVETASIKNNVTDGFGLLPYSKFVESVSKIYGLVTEYEVGDPLNFKDTDTYGDPLAALNQAAPRYFLADVTFTDGTTGQAYVHILGSTYDPNKVGNQQITLYLGVATDGLYLDYVVSGMMPNIVISDYPLSGVISYNTSVEVLPDISQGATYKIVDKSGNDADKLFVAANNGAKLYGLSMLITNGDNSKKIALSAANTKILDAQGNDITSTALKSNGQFVAAGTYTVSFNYKTYSANVAVGSYSYALTNQNGENLGTTVRFGEELPVVYLTLTKPDGSTSPLALSNTIVKINNVTLSDANKGNYFETAGSKNVLKENAALYKKNIVITGSVQTEAGNVSVRQSLQITYPNNTYALRTGYVPELTATDTFNGTTVFFIDYIDNSGKTTVYIVSKTANGWQAVSGETALGIDFTVTGVRKNDNAAVTFNEDGSFGNLLNAQDTVYVFTLTCSDKTASVEVTVTAPAAQS